MHVAATFMGGEGLDAVVLAGTLAGLLAILVGLLRGARPARAPVPVRRSDPRRPRR